MVDGEIVTVLREKRLITMPLGSYSTGNAGGIYDLLTTWQQIGVFDYVLPFILVFALVFAVLQKTGILGQEKKNLNDEEHRVCITAADIVRS